MEDYVVVEYEFDEVITLEPIMDQSTLDCKMSNAQRILGPALEVYNKLPPLMKHVIDGWLEDRCTKVLYDKGEVLDAWLEWNGFIGYGEDFRDLFEAMK